MLVQDPTKVQTALNIKDSRFKEGRHFVTIALNLKEPYQIEKKFRKAIALLDGRIDCLMLCHGAIKNESIFDTNMLEWDEMMNLNVRATFQLVSLAVPFLKLTKGCITILSSNAGKTPQPGSIIYSTSMAMVNMLVETTALETSFFGVRVNAVAPGVTNTQARMKKDSLGLSEAQNRTFLIEAGLDVPLQNQLNQPSEVAKAMLWLSSSDASFITGEILTIDGGQSLTSNDYPDYLRLLAQARAGGESMPGLMVGKLVGKP